MIGGFASQVADQVQKSRHILVAVVSAAIIVVALVAAAGLFGGAKVIPASQATSLGLFSGKAATAADTAIIKAVTTCGKASGTIESVQWSGPPLRVSGDKLGTNASLSAPGPSGQSEASCLAGLFLTSGATAQSCPAIALSSGGASTADSRSFTEQLVSCLSAVGAS